MDYYYLQSKHCNIISGKKRSVSALFAKYAMEYFRATLPFAFTNLNAKRITIILIGTKVLT